jgi:hypothetical protein
MFFFCLNDFFYKLIRCIYMPGLTRVDRVMGRPAGSDRFFTFTGLLRNSDRSSPRVNLSGQSGFYNYAIKHILGEKNLWDKPVICRRDHKCGATTAAGEHE